MKSVFSILSQQGKQSPVMRSAVASLAVEKANEVLKNIFGKEILEFIKAAHVKEKTLTIEVKSSSAAAEIRLNQENILNELNDLIAPERLEKIHCITGKESMY